MASSVPSRSRKLEWPRLGALFAHLPGRALFVLIGTWIAAMAIVAALLAAGRGTAIDHSKRSTAAMSLIVQENTSRLFHAIELTLGGIADTYAFAAPLQKNDAGFRALMRQRLQGLPDVRAIFIIGPDGFLQHDTDYPHTRDVSLADRAYFKAHAADASLRTTISEPLASRSGNGWFVAVTHRLERQGRFEGIVAAAVQASRFEELYRRADIFEGDVIALVHESGALVARHPADPGAVGRPFAPLSAVGDKLRAHPDGVLLAGSLLAAEEVVAYRPLDGRPLGVFLSRGAESIFAEWRRTAIGALVAAGALTLLLTAFISHLIAEANRREAERLRHAQAEKLEALGQLTGGIAHDFGNLLHIVSMNLEMLRILPHSDPRTHVVLRTAQQATVRGTELIARLLAFARRQPLECAPCNLNELVEGSRELLAQAAGPGIAIECTFGALLPPVLCDQGQLETALVNLVVNAKYAMAGVGHIKLDTFECAPDDAFASAGRKGPPLRVCLTVADNGPGMPEEVRRRALEPFFSTKGNAGTGLGLSQVYGFMHQIGGDLRIESLPGHGTAIHMYFPGAGREDSTIR